MPLHSETIISAIKTALEGISTASGYGMTVESVQRYDRHSLSTRQRPCILLASGPERKAREGDGDGWYVTLEVEISLHLNQQDSDSDPTDKYQLARKWDVEQCLSKDVDWTTLQTELVSVEAAGFEIEDPEGSIEDGVMMSLTCTYKVAGEDMTTLIY